MIQWCERRTVTRWSCADHYEIVQTVRIQFSDQANTARELIFARISQQLAAWAEYDR